MHVWISFVCKRKVCICIRIFVRVFGLCAEACVYQSLFVTFMSVPVCVRMRACEEQKKPIQKEIDDKREPERITQRHSNSRRDGLCSVTIMLPPHPTHILEPSLVSFLPEIVEGGVAPQHGGKDGQGGITQTDAFEAEMGGGAGERGDKSAGGRGM